MIDIKKLSFFSLYVCIIAILSLQFLPELKILKNGVLCICILLGIILILKRGKFFLTYYCLFYVFFLLYNCFQSIYLRNSQAEYTLFQMFTCFILIVVTVNILVSNGQIERSLYAVITGGTVFSLVVFSKYNFNIAQISSALSQGTRIGSELTNPNFLGIICSYVACLGIFLFFENIKNKNYTNMIFIGGSTILCFSFSILSGSRKTYLTLFVGFIIFFYSFLKKNLTLKRVFVSSIFFIIIITMFRKLDMFTLSRERLQQLIFMFFGEGTAEGSMNHRKLLIEQATQLFFKRPFFGNGIESVRETTGYYAHNNFVEILANNGVIGFLIYYSSYFITFICLIIVKNKKDVLYSCMLFTFFSILINEVAQVTYYDRFSQIRFAIISSYLIIELYSEKGKNV
ncbi:hypothetical protein NRIC_30230 [Enterococcus florum]|uniref:O-antigen ligase-related domain-containing protein n=1 Tax=Enterococcus florum TaxID=2480627 RepID=A0A4P5PHL0_9ENTE|nr:O-antigen ligase family protein [Enterococcus florum]GCF95132.1 hypothetical protein NRIC_30230 [Enterococcus florum]